MELQKVCTSSHIKKLTVAVSLLTIIIILHGVLFSNSLQTNFVRALNSTGLQVEEGGLQRILPSGLFDLSSRQTRGKTFQQLREQQPNTVLEGGTDVIISAYMRTGSTFLGKVIGWRDDVFYWFEPMRQGRSWSYLRGRDLLCDTLVPKCNIITDAEKTSSEKALQFMEDMFQCRLKGHDDVATDINFNRQLSSQSWDSYINCTLPYRMDAFSKKKCLPKLEESCKSAKHRVAKVLRMETGRIGDMLETNPRLKIVQLLRDPRGSLYSHFHTGWYSPAFQSNATIAQDCQVLCSRLLNDILDSMKLAERYPTRVKIVQYEDLDDVYKKINIIYRFLGFEVSPKYDKFVKDSYSGPSGTDVGGGFHPFSYREKLPWYIVQHANKYCSRVYELLGLRKFNTIEEYKNMDINPIIKLPFSLTDS